MALFAFEKSPNVCNQQYFFAFVLTFSNFNAQCTLNFLISLFTVQHRCIPDLAQVNNASIEGITNLDDLREAISNVKYLAKAEEVFLWH